jgi:hypothetical protein
MSCIDYHTFHLYNFGLLNLRGDWYYCYRRQSTKGNSEKMEYSFEWLVESMGVLPLRLVEGLETRIGRCSGPRSYRAAPIARRRMTSEA